MNRNRRFQAVALLACVLAIPGASAATQSGNVTVSMNVLQAGSCSLIGYGLYPTYDPASPNPADASSGMTLTCSYGTTWVLTFDEGSNAQSGSTCAVPLRRVANGTSYVGYGIYQDSGYTQPLGCDPSNDLEGTGTGGPQYPVVHFRAPAGQTPTVAGTHTDSILLTLTF